MGSVRADEAFAAFGAVGAFQEIHLAADAGKLAGAGGFAVLLAHQVHLHAAVDGDHVLQARDPRGVVDIIEVAGPEQVRALREPVVQVL